MKVWSVIVLLAKPDVRPSTNPVNRFLTPDATVFPAAWVRPYAVPPTTFEVAVPSSDIPEAIPEPIPALILEPCWERESLLLIAYFTRWNCLSFYKCCSSKRLRAYDEILLV